MPPRVERVELRYFGKKSGSINAKQWAAHQAVTQDVHTVGIEGAGGSGKTYWLINETLDLCLRFPGCMVILSRWTQDSLDAVLRPLFYKVIREDYDEEILATQLPHKGWIAAEERQILANNSSVYLRALKSGDDNNRYAKFDGLTLGAVAISQAEEVPKDIFQRLRVRLRQPGVPHHFLFEMNPVHEDHHIYREFKAPDPSRRLLVSSTYDNEANLPPDFIRNLERDYPPGHPLRRRMLFGERGLSARGDPVVGELFNHRLHIQEVEYDPGLPLILSYDPGARHPAVSWAQITLDGQLRVLDCYLGTDTYADEFFQRVFQQQAETFGEVVELYACGDRAMEQHKGSSKKTEFDIFKQWLKPWGVSPKVGVVADKAFLVQQFLSYFTRLVRGQPAIVFHPRCAYLIEAMEGGWVWDEPTEARPTPKLPKQDGYYDHGVDTLLYIKQHFGPGIRQPRKAHDPDAPPRPPKRKRTTAAGD